MARFLLRRTSRFPFSAPTPPASTIRCLCTAEITRADEVEEVEPKRTVFSDHHRKHLLFPFSGGNPMEGFSIELVDDKIWKVSSCLSSDRTCVAETAPGREEAAGVGEEEWSLGFDDIEDMRIRKKLFYKMDRNSMEYEECSFDFHRRKSTKKGRDKTEEEVSRKVSKKKEEPKLKLRSRDARVRDSDRLNAASGLIDGGEKEGTNLGLDSGVTSRQNSNGVRNERCGNGIGTQLIDGKRERNLDLKSSPEGSSTNVLDHFDVDAVCERSKSLNSILDSGDDVHKNSKLFKTESYRVETKTRPVKGSKEKMPDFSLNGAREILNAGLRPRDTELPNVDIFSIEGCVRTSLDAKKPRTLTYNQLTDPYHLPFCLDIYITKGSVRACIIHRVTSKVVVVAHSISKDMKFDLKSRKDVTACAVVGGALAQRAISDDIHNVVYTPRKGEKIEGKLQIVLQSIIDHGMDVKVKIKQRRPFKRSVYCFYFSGNAFSCSSASSNSEFSRTR